MADLDKFVKLLATNDGRDKIYKGLAGVVKILAAYSASKESAKKFTSLGKSIGEGRSIMRMAKWVNNINKFQTLLPKLIANPANTKNTIEVFRVLGDFGYVLGDNLSYLSKYKVLSLNAAEVTKKAKVWQFWGYFCAVILDILAVNATLAKQSSDAATAKKEIRANILSLIKDLADFLVVLATVGYVKAFKPSATVQGLLTLLSGSIATYQNWTKLK